MRGRLKKKSRKMVILFGLFENWLKVQMGEITLKKENERWWGRRNAKRRGQYMPGARIALRGRK